MSLFKRQKYTTTFQHNSINQTHINIKVRSKGEKSSK